MIRWFTSDPVDRVTASTGGMNMCTGGGGVNGDLPAKFSLFIGRRLQPGFDLCPETGVLPGLKQCVDPPPRAITDRDSRVERGDGSRLSGHAGGIEVASPGVMVLVAEV